MSTQELKEPKFLGDLHKVRSRLAKMPREKYEEYLQRALDENSEKLGHLYVENV